MHVSVSKCCCFDLRTGTGILLTLSLIGSIVSVFFGYMAWTIIDIAIYGIACIAFFKEKPKWLIPSIVWMIVEPVLGTIYLILVGHYDGIFKPIRELTTERFKIAIIIIYVANLMIFVLYLLAALVVWSFYKSKMRQETLNRLQNHTQNQQAKVDFVV